MRRQAFILCIAVGLFLGGCQTAAKRASDAYYERIQFKPPEATLTAVGVQQSSVPVTEEDIEHALSQSADLKVPMRLAFFEVAGATDDRLQQRMRQLPPDKREEWQKKLKASKFFTAVEEVPSLLLPASFDLRRLRLEAARLNADCLLLYATNSDRYEYTNALAAAYLLILPVWFVPGNHVDNFTGLMGAVIDVRTGKVLAGFSTVGESRQVVAYSAVDRGARRAVVNAQIQALDQMAEKVAAFATAARK